MISIRVHRSYRNVVAVCDVDLLGQKFDEGKIQLDVRENFFKGENFEFKKAEEILKKEREDDSTFNIVGKNAVDLALSLGIISEGNIGNVGGVPFALVFG